MTAVRHDITSSTGGGCAAARKLPAVAVAFHPTGRYASSPAAMLHTNRHLWPRLQPSPACCTVAPADCRTLSPPHRPPGTRIHGEPAPPQRHAVPRRCAIDCVFTPMLRFTGAAAGAPPSPTHACSACDRPRLAVHATRTHTAGLASNCGCSPPQSEGFRRALRHRLEASTPARDPPRRHASKPRALPHSTAQHAKHARRLSFDHATLRCTSACGSGTVTRCSAARTEPRAAPASADTGTSAAAHPGGGLRPAAAPRASRRSGRGCARAAGPGRQDCRT